MWWDVSEDDKAVGSTGTDDILQREKPSFGDWACTYWVTGLWWLRDVPFQTPGRSMGRQRKCVPG